MENGCVTTDDLEQLLKAENKDICQKILPAITKNEEDGTLKFSENEIKIVKGINLFNERLNRAYEIRYGERNVYTRDYLGTNENILLEFFVAYRFSKYYREVTEEDKKINYNIFEQLKNIIFEIYVIFEFEILDENELYKEKSENEYELLYNLNKAQNLIIKTRILWEKIMNFFYLLIERKEIPSSKSKKSKFKTWCKNKDIVFLDHIIEKLEAFDSTFRTGEVHEYSKLKNYFERGINQNINLYCLNLLFAFSNETIINIMAYINGIEPKYRMWQKLPKDISEQLEEFTDVPEWVKKYTENEKIYDILEKGAIINNYEEVKKEMFNQ